MEANVPVQDPFSLVIQQLRKINADLTSLIQKYVQTQGFANLDIPRESASMDVVNWTEMTAEQRLLANLSAFLELERRLERVIEEQKELLHPQEHVLHGDLHNMLGQVAALREQLEQIGEIFGLNRGNSSDTDGMGVVGGSVFDKKVRGYKVLRELSVWSIRSVRDILKIQREREKYVRESMKEAETLMERVETHIGRE
ncbi:ciliary neurotrophic factor isoform X1 [Pelobates fuscus]|uniref:ciliary neurotrophic factor isoform X1 n=1 Tax=Pelobates fuscus TaxID=191477 RepID=UPI002FE4F635